MSPDSGTTVSSPLLAFHLAGPPFALSQPLRLLPSNNTIASEGGAPSRPPGVTIAGTGCQTSVASGGGRSAAIATPVMSNEAQVTMSFIEQFPLDKSSSQDSSPIC